MLETPLSAQSDLLKVESAVEGMPKQSHALSKNLFFTLFKSLLQNKQKKTQTKIKQPTKQIKPQTIHQEPHTEFKLNSLSLSNPTFQAGLNSMKHL